MLYAFVLGFKEGFQRTSFEVGRTWGDDRDQWYDIGANAGILLSF